MKIFSALLFVAVLLAVSCERIPPSVSIPGYDKKEAAAQKTEDKPLGAAENPPTFFPNPENAAPAAPAVAKDHDDDDDDADDKHDD